MGQEAVCSYRTRGNPPASSLKHLFNFYKRFVCIASMFICVACVCQDARPPGVGDENGYGSLCGRWELNPGPRQDLQRSSLLSHLSSPKN